MEKLTKDFLSRIIQPRPVESHKGTFGHVVIIGGNKYYGGAVLMSAEAAIKAGAGLVSVVTDRSNHAALHARLPEAIVIDWQDDVALVAALGKATVILIGPGLGEDSFAQQLLMQVVSQQRKAQRLVIDGSGISLLAQTTFTLPLPELTIFTPHQIEWQRLSGLVLTKQTPANNLTYQKKLGATVVLKSHRTTIYTSTMIYQNTLGTPAMATAGMGDTLAGMITGFLAQFSDITAAVCGAVYLHSFIGETLGAKQYVVLPTDISQQLPLYMKKFE